MLGELRRNRQPPVARRNQRRRAGPVAPRPPAVL